MYVLIILMFTNAGSGAAVYSVDFVNQKSCEQARAAVVAFDRQAVRATCTPKQ